MSKVHSLGAIDCEVMAAKSPPGVTIRFLLAAKEGEEEQWRAWVHLGPALAERLSADIQAMLAASLKANDAP